MSDPKGGSVTIDGLEDLRRLGADLSKEITRELHGNAQASARRVADHAKQNLIAEQKTQSRKLAQAIKIEDDLPNQSVDVVSYPPIGQPTSLPIWNEYGTVKMAARAYMRRAAAAERGTYTRQAIAVLERVLAQRGK